MQKIVDATLLRHVALEEYLQADPGHQAVFTDYACMECYKGNALSNIGLSLRIVSKYPEQVVVLKGTRDIIRLQASGPHVRDDFIDSQQTGEFREFVRDVRSAVEGHAGLRARVEHLANLANEHFRQMQQDAFGVAEAIRETAESFQPSQLAELRRPGPISKETGDVIVRNILTLAALLLKAHPHVVVLPTLESLRDTLVFRFALASQLLVVRWLGKGGIENVRMDRLRNDMVDMTYVAYATLFEGILSNDRKLLGVYDESVFFLERVFGIGGEEGEGTSRGR
jgi:hypothetical protein